MQIKRQRFSESFFQLRKRRGLSQIGLAQRAGRAQARVSEVENADRDPRLSTLLAIADALDAELMPIPREKLEQVRRLLVATTQPAQTVPGDVFDELFVPSVSEPPEEEAASEDETNASKS